MASEFAWTEDAIACLRAFWRDGHSTAAIGRRMGISKNAVVGKAHRLDLPPRPSPIRGKSADGTPRPPAPKRTRGPTLPAPCPAADAPPPAPVRTKLPPSPPAPARPAKPAPSRPAPRHPCCWPIGHPGAPGFRFCDADALPRKPYCAEHAGTAYVAPEAAASIRRGGAG